MTCALAIATLISLAQAAPLPAGPNVPTNVWTDLSTDVGFLEETEVHKIVWSNVGQTKTITDVSQTGTIVTYMPSVIGSVCEYYGPVITVIWSKDYLSQPA